MQPYNAVLSLMIFDDLFTSRWNIEHCDKKAARKTSLWQA
jgi:hypothetical protein